MRPKHYVLSNALKRLALLAVLSLITGLIQGATAALGLACLGLLTLLGYHLYQLSRFSHWARMPVGTPLPQTRGSWDWLYADLTHRLRSNSALREELSALLTQFQEATQALPDALIFLDSEDAIMWCNTRAEAAFSLSAQRDAGQIITRLIRLPDFAKYLKHPNPEHPLTLELGATWLIQILPFGKAQRLVVARDVTQIEKLETVRRDFVANVSHEMRTPLTVIAGFLETLEMHAQDLSPEEICQYVAHAQTQSNRMQRLIDDLLTLAKLDSNTPSHDFTLINLSQLAQDVFAETKHLGHHALLVEAHIAPGLFVQGHAKELHSALANLCSNAVRYSKSQGHIEIRLELRDSHVYFSVKDDGIGIAAEHLPRLTERFYRVDAGRSRAAGGTGLGLAIVKHVMQRHQGQLLIESSPGQGSCFTLRLPLEHNEQH